MSTFISATLEGFALVISPCVLSILPLILSSSVQGSKVKLIGILTGLFGSFILFSLLLGNFVRSLGFSDQLVKLFAMAFIVLSCFFMLSSRLNDFLYRLLQPLASAGQKLNLVIAEKTRMTSFVGGILMGICLGLIWTPCIGPILGAALTQAASQVSIADNITVMLFFALGASIPISLIVSGGRFLIGQVQFLQQNALFLRRALAMVIMVSIVVTNYSLLDQATKDWKNFALYHGTPESANTIRVGCNIDL
ncbi:MAG: cytochrome c biogenesis protein CcdA [Candidatus Caenarcaniphilales bacterium]|nr:cytochrome c biogenesis protein CcdA [Candidatus Caenarcaniphilales bacterium]